MINQLSYVKESYLEDPSHINYILDHLSGMLQVPPDFGRSEGATLLLAPVPPPGFFILCNMPDLFNLGILK